MINNAVLRLMLEQGGKFERRLADLYFVADSENAKKLELAFNEIFTKFKNLAGEV